RRDFVANASHELKTPLTAIRGYSETLLDPTLPPELVRRFADVVHANAQRLQRIVDDLLDLSRIETGGWVAYSEPVDLAAAAREAWEEAVRSAEAAEHEFRVHVDGDAPAAYCDPAALRQIFANLFANSLRYTPPGGSVEVRVTAAVEPAGEAKGQWVRIEV